MERDPVEPKRLRHKFTDQVTYEAEPTANPCRRIIERLRTHFRSDQLDGLLPLGALESLALPGESYKLAFTPGLLSQVFIRARQGQADDILLPEATRATDLGGQSGSQGGYVDLDANKHWWLPSGRSFYHPADVLPPVELDEARANFFLPRRYQDPFGQDTNVDFDYPNNLLMVETRDALGNSVSVDLNDYRVLQPRLVSDPNRNQTEVAFDALGMVVGTAVMGKPLAVPTEGDSLTGFDIDLTQAQLDAFFDAVDPHTNAPTLLRDATTRFVYDLDRFRRTQQANPNDPTKWQPAFTATLARETHASVALPPQGLKIQVSISYSDGFGREIQKKIQSEPGPLVDEGPVVNPRWVGSGWTIFNNKGKPVRQYEPFFSATHGFEFGAQVGVSTVVFYDPAERVVVTLHPNHTYEKVVFDPWQQTTYDVNDTCAPRPSHPDVTRPPQTGDPRNDPDIGGYVAEFFKTQPPAWQTWYAQRIGGVLGQDERNAAVRAEAHADTPTAAHFDSLGRPFLTVARNRVVCAGHDLDGTEEPVITRLELDIEGNQRSVVDERRLPVNHLPTGPIEQRIVMRYAHDMLSNRIQHLSMEAGTRWMLNDVAGKTVRTWDSRGHNFTTTYDVLRRAVQQTVRGTIANGDAASDPRTLGRDIVVDRISYGETLANAEALNLRTRIYQHFDSAGLASNAKLMANGDPIEAYDFKGNLLRSTRRLAGKYDEVPDWSQPPEAQLEAEYFESSTRYDALNRPVQSVAPHSNLTRPEHPNKFNVIQPVFNEANLLERVDVWLEQVAEPGALLNPNNAAPSPVGVASIDYDSKGQRQRIDFKNGVTTSYSYDPLTFRLTQLVTRRNKADFPDDDPQPPVARWPGRQVQNLRYNYDPAGNISHIQDDAQQAVYFRNRRVEPSNDYIYDALYRLIQASGREHLGQGGGPTPYSYNDAGHTGILTANPAGHFAPNDGVAMGNYSERYVYDAVGNFLQMQHERSDAAVAGWTRLYTYLEASLIEPAKYGNCLSGTTVGAQPDEIYAHDKHGNMLQMPQLAEMQWDYRDQLRLTRRQRINADDLEGEDHDGERTFYIYDAAGQRVRKVSRKALGLTEERIYLGGFEVFRRHGRSVDPNTAALERETLHLMDDKQLIALVETRTVDVAVINQAPRQLIRYQFGNHLGSASLELDNEAQIISYEEYSPYGSSTYQAVRSQTETAKRYRYTGKERDEESGFYYHGARYYAPWLGRWISADPALADGTNFYAYVRNAPIGLRDSNGMAAGPPPVLPAAPGMFGFVTRYSQQAAALYDAVGRRLTESEHVVARGQLEALTTDPATGTADYTDSHYRADDTVRFERSAALDKTHGNRGGVTADNVVTKQLKATVKQGGSLNKNEILMNAVDNAQRAAKKTGSTVSEGALNRAALGQDGNLFSLKTLSETGQKIGATTDDVEKALQTFELGESAPKATPAAVEGAVTTAVEATSAEASAVSKVGAGGRVLQGLAVVGALTGGIQVGGGINKIIEGKAADGAIDVGEGSANLGLSIGTAVAVKAGVLTAETGLAAGTLTAGAGLAAAGSVVLLAETARAASKGEETPIDVADKFYGTHFGDIYGWVSGDYSRK